MAAAFVVGKTKMPVLFTETSTATFPQPAGGGRMTFIDADGDGDMDILYQTGADGTAFQYAQSNGDGTYTIMALNLSPFNGLTIPNHNGGNFHVGDIDGDGDFDLWAGQAAGAGTGSYFRNDNGTFTNQSAASFPQPAASSRSVMGDFDNDGDADILYQTAGNGTPFQYAQSNGNGTYTLVAQASSPFAGLTLPDNGGGTYYAGDFDGDGDTDVWAAVGSATGSYFRNDGGTFSSQASATFPAGGAAGRVVVGDFDSDGDDDILYQTGADGSAWQYARSNGDGTMTILAQASSPFSGVTLLNHNGSNYIAGDVDGDGDDDLIGTPNGTQGEFYLANGKPPEIASSTPSDNATGVSATANIVITFDESVVKGSGNIRIFRGSDDALIETIAVGSAQVSGSGTTWTIDPSVTLAGLTNYYVLFDDGTFADLDGSIFFGVDDKTTLNFTTAVVNTAPTFTNLNGDAPSFTEGGAAVRLDVAGNATVADAENANFNTGTLTVTITAGGTAAQDVLSVANIGVLAGQISVSGANISYQGVQIATFTGGTGGVALVITLDPDATPAATQALVRALQYNNTNNANPSTTNRTVTVVLTDGAGGTSTTQTVTVGVSAVNDAPVNVVGGTASGAEDSVSIALTGISISDVDANPAAQIMTVTLTVPVGTLDIRTDVAGGVTAGMVSGDGSGTIVITATQNQINATLANATGLLFSPPADYNGSTALTVTTNDNDNGGAGSDPGNTGTATTEEDSDSKTITVTAVNDAAVVISIDTPTYTEGGAAVAVSPTLTITDLDSANMTGATITVSDFVAGDLLTFVNQNGISGSYNSGTGVLTLTGTASVATYQAALRSITYAGAADANVGGTDLARTVSFVVTDGVVSNTATATITIDNASGPSPGDDTLPGTGGDDTISGLGGEDVISGGAGDDFLDGGADDDTLNGGADDDYLRGGSGADHMLGGTGNDTYVVENVGDVVDETGGDGVDTVWSRIGYTLGADIENLTFGAGAGAVDGAGNALDNTLTGNYAVNVLRGLDGEDILLGDGGNDRLSGGNDDDILDGGSQDDFLDGGAGADDLVGGAGNDYLRGGAGADEMKGGLGNDLYAVENIGDIVDETGGGGIDLVWSRISYTLGTDIENLTLGAGGGATNGTGNSLNNIITGNYAINVLQGLDGADTLLGDGGNDLLEGGAGIDKLYGGSQDDYLDGGAGNDLLFGELGNDYLLGKEGNDSMTGGTGRDTFAFGSDDIGASLEHDKVLDFSLAEGDRINLSGIDADDSLGGDQAFSLVTAFSHTAGQAKLTYSVPLNQTQILLDVDGDGLADHQITVNGNLTAMAVLTGGEPASAGGWIL